MHVLSKVRIFLTEIGFRIEQANPSCNECNTFSINRHLCDSEDKRICISIKRSMEKQRKKIDAISGFKFTVGHQETKDFSTKNNMDKVRGCFHYQTCLELGSHEQVTLWIHMVDVDESDAACLTDLILVPRNHVSRDLIHQGFLLLASHDLLHCALVGKSDPRKQSVISRIQLSLANKDERTLARTHVAISGCLSSYGLAKGRLWILHLSRNEKALFMGTLRSHNEFCEYVKDISSNPYDRKLCEYITMRSKALQNSHNLERTELNIESHLVPYVVGFLCMDVRDIISFEATFRLIDRNGSGVITIPELLTFIQANKTLEKLVQNLLNLPLEPNYNVSCDQGWTFESTLNAVSVFAMFGEKEILQWILCMYDDHGTGRINPNSLIELTLLLHPRRKEFMIKVVQTATPSDVEYITLDDMIAINEDFPQLFYPIYELQVCDVCQ
jgi:Ca2+-binding EF-hand superfamily protein